MHRLNHDEVVTLVHIFWWLPYKFSNCAVLLSNTKISEGSWVALGFIAMRLPSLCGTTCSKHGVVLRCFSNSFATTSRPLCQHLGGTKTDELFGVSPENRSAVSEIIDKVDRALDSWSIVATDFVTPPGPYARHIPCACNTRDTDVLTYCPYIGSLSQDDIEPTLS